MRPVLELKRRPSHRGHRVDFPKEAAPTVDFPRRVQRNGRMRPGAAVAAWGSCAVGTSGSPGPAPELLSLLLRLSWESCQLKRGGHSPRARIASGLNFVIPEEEVMTGRKGEYSPDVS